MTYDPLQKDPALPSCLTLLTLTLNETKCHIVNPKPFDECKVRDEHETVSLSYILCVTSVHSHYVYVH